MTEPEPSIQRRPFKSITRTIEPLGRYATLDAVCVEGRAWWLITGCDDAPEEWTELPALPEIDGDTMIFP